MDKQKDNLLDVEQIITKNFQIINAENAKLMTENTEHEANIHKLRKQNNKLKYNSALSHSFRVIVEDVKAQCIANIETLQTLQNASNEESTILNAALSDWCNICQQHRETTSDKYTVMACDEVSGEDENVGQQIDASNVEISNTLELKRKESLELLTELTAITEQKNYLGELEKEIKEKSNDVHQKIETKRYAYKVKDILSKI